MTTFKATITKTKNAEPLGQYVETSVDLARSGADIRIVGYVRNRTEIETRCMLSGAGVKRVSVVGNIGRYIVTDDAMTELRRRYSLATDF